MSIAYYNEFDPYAAQWLRNLITRGLIAPGEVDERSIEDVRPDDLRGFTQCHFFAGIGVWSHALRQAGWPDDRPVWTGSCPCQPFSQAGREDGVADKRHLWPAFFHLISECQPDIVLGEQVEGAIKHYWLDLVQDDLEGAGYATGAVCAPAACVGAPHIRSRLYWVGAKQSATCHFCGCRFDSDGARFFGCPNCCADGLGDPNNSGLEGYSRDGNFCGEEGAPGSVAETGGSVGRVADTEMLRCEDDNEQRRYGASAGPSKSRVGISSNGLYTGRVADTYSTGCSSRSEAAAPARHGSTPDTASWTNGFWQDADWLPFRDSKFRPVEPGTFPMAPRTPTHVGRCRAYGNAIVAPLATEFIKAVMAST